MTGTITVEVWGAQDAKCQTIGCDRAATILQMYENKAPDAEPWAEWVCNQCGKRYARVAEWPETGYRVVGRLQSYVVKVPA